jgi:hypothetical protein
MNLHSLTRRLLQRTLRARRTDPIRKPHPSLLGRPLETLEDRSVPANVTITGGNLFIDLDTANENFTISTSASGQYTLASDQGFTGDFTGAGPFTTGTLASGKTVQITDSVANTSVTFADSSADYANTVSVILDDGSNGVTFSGTTSFAGSAQLGVTADRSVVVNAGAAVSTDTGLLSLDGNYSAGTGTGNFSGLDIQGSVSTTNASITLQGQGGNTGLQDAGVNISGSVSAGGAGSLFIRGRGGVITAGPGGFAYGVLIANNGPSVSTVDGLIDITGTGGSKAGSAGNIGVAINTLSGVAVQSTGLGSISINGTGGTGASNNYGIWFTGAAAISTAKGDITLTGTHGTGSTLDYGVLLYTSGGVSAGGTGTVSIQGFGSGAAGVSIDYLSSVQSNNGKISITGSDSTGTDIRVEGGAAIASGGTGDVDLTANTLDIASTASVTAGSSADQTVTVANRSSGVAIDLGGADVVATPVLGLDATELNRFFAGTLVIGSANAGAITVSADINPANVLNQFTIGVAGGGIINLNANVSTSNDANVTFANNVTLGADSTVDTGAGDITFSGTVRGGKNLVANSTGATTFTGAVGVGTALASLQTNAGGSTQINGGSVTTTGAQSYGDTINTGGTTTFAADSLSAGAINATGNLTFNLANTSNITGTIAGTGSTVTKQGAGTLSLSGTNSYNGLTTVSAGVLLIDGLIPGNATVTGGTLGGGGSIGGTVNVNSGGAITGGDLGSVGTLTVGTLTFNGGTYKADFANDSSDTIAVTGAVDLANPTKGVFSINSQTGITSDGNEFLLIDNQGGSIISNKFSGINENTAGTVNGKNGHFSYSGSANDQSFTFTTNGTPNITLAGGTFTLVRVLANGADKIRLLDSNNIVVKQFNAASVTSITVNGSNTADTLIIDDGGSGGIIDKDITFNGNLGFDTLRIPGGSFGTVAFLYTNANDGFIKYYTGASSIGLQRTITYTGLSPILNTGTAIDLIFDLPAAASVATLGDDGTPGNGFSTLSSTPATFENTTFANPTGSLTINRGNAADTLTINATPDLTSAISIGTAATPFASISAAGALSSLSTVDLAAQDIAVNASLAGTTVTLNATTGAITTSGGDVTATTLFANAVTGIDLNTHAGSISASNTGAGDITFNEADGATLTNITATNGSIQVTSMTGNLVVGTISASADVTLQATTGSILDDNNDATRITAVNLSLTAAVDIGQPLGGTQVEDIDTNVTTITAATTGSSNAGIHGIWIDDLNGVTLTSVTTQDGLIQITTGGTTVVTNVAAAGSGRDATIIASAGDITVATASSSKGNVTLTATNGSILDDGNNTTKISGNVVNLTAQVDIGRPAPGAEIDTAATTINASTTGSPGAMLHGIWISEQDDVTLTKVTTQDGLINISAGGSVTATNVAAAGAGRNVSITASSDITAATVSSAAGNVTLIAMTGSILDDGVNSTRISGNVVTLTAQVDIGGPGATANIDTAANSISASTTGPSNTGTHGIWINELDAVTLTNVTTQDGLITITAGGSITATNVAAAGAGRNVSITASSGDITATAVSSAGGDMNLASTTGYIGFGTLSANGATSLNAGGKITANGTSTSASLTLMAGTDILQTGGSLNAATQTLSANGKIDQTGGVVTGTSLAASAGAGISLPSANAFSNFSATNTGGAVTLHNTIPLNLVGITQTGTTVSVNNDVALAVGGAVTATTGNIDLNVLAGGIAINTATSKVSSTGGNVLLNAVAGGVSETANALGVQGQVVALQGAGTFDLNNANNDAGTMFRALVNGALTFRDANDLTVDPTNGVKTGNNDATLYAGTNFTAVNDSATLVDAGSGIVRIVPGASLTATAAASFTYNSEVKGSQVFFGNDDPGFLANVAADAFHVRPSRISPVTVVGNDPTTAPGDSITPIFTDPRITNVNFIVENQVGQSISGRYEITYSDLPAPVILRFREIESLGNLGYRGIVTQTANAVYSIRLQLSQLTPFPGSVKGQALQSSPFVVSPNVINPLAPYSAPNIAFGDVNGDGTVDLIIANGSNDVPQVTVINGFYLFRGQAINLADLKSLKQLPTDPEPVLAQFYAFPDANGQPTFRGGLSVAVKSNGVGQPADIVVGPGPGGGPVVQVWSGTGILKSSFLAYESSFRGGVTVATGDYNGNGTQDIIVGTGPGGGPRVRVFEDGNYANLTADFFAYDPSFRGGVLVAAGNFNGDNKEDIATAPGFGGGPHVRVFGYNGANPPQSLASFFAWDAASTNGLQLLGTSANNGIGSISFGAPELLAPGVGDPNGRQELLVSSARGTALQMSRFIFDANTTAPKAVRNLFDELTVPDLFEDGVHFAGIPIQDPVTGQVLTENQLFEGGSVAGFSVK